jgi:pimeloyl-ACP methyl ester carboxylesterase
VAGVRTRVLEVGPESPDGQAARRGVPHRAPRLLLLHGFCDSADTWRPVLTQLAAAGHAAVAVALPGFGEADPLRRGAMLPQLDTFTAALVSEQAALGEVVLAGNSLGGTMGLRAAQERELGLRGTVSIAAPGLADAWMIRALARYPVPLRLWASLPLPVPDVVVRTLARRLVPRYLYADAGMADQAHVQRFIELFPDYRSTTGLLEQARLLVAELQQAYQLERVHAPLLVVACGKDRLVGPAAGHRLHALVPHSRLLVRQDWGHCPQLDDPAAVAEVLTGFAANALTYGSATARTAPGITRTGTG